VAHRFSSSCVRAESELEPYWRDVGTIDAYWQANIDLTDVVPSLDLYDHSWPLWTYSEVTPPAKFVHNEDGRRGSATSSLVAGGCIVSGSSLHRSLLFSGVRTHSFSSVTDSIIMPGCEIGRGARLHKCVVDSGILIPPGLIIGEDPVLDAQRFRRTDSGICLVSQPMIDRLEVCPVDDDAAFVRRLGSLSARQDRWAGRRGRSIAGRAGGTWCRHPYAGPWISVSPKETG
jgi:glucose-1-phosphate adenylyltransferase